MINLAKLKPLQFYTDGSCWPNPGPGGWSVVNEHLELVAFGSDPATTNIRMEGIALREAMTLVGNMPCTIYTDSELWVNIITIYAKIWKKNGWRKGREGKEPANLDLVTANYDLFCERNVDLQWVRGHNGSPGNEKADEYAGKAKDNQVPTTYWKERVLR